LPSARLSIREAPSAESCRRNLGWRLLGPAVAGGCHRRLGSRSDPAPSKHLNVVYWLGLLLLMFLSGAETQQLFSREERREVGWLAIVGTGIPFVLGLCGPMAD